jgi:hypothetical protein
MRQLDNIQGILKPSLENAYAKLKLTSVYLPRADGLMGLARQVEEPCVVAVVGRVKAGKSTFINALLGEDLAKVGVTETTATINYFVYGKPDPYKPVRCYWRGGQYTDEDRAFLDRLQGNDEETLRLAEGIDHLEYRMLNNLLAQMTVVDTPGTGAVVDEHQHRTADYIRLYGQLRDRHNEETKKLNDTSDAIIYLIGQVARATDRDFLEEFNQATLGRSRALNAIGVMAKIDLHPDILANAQIYAAKIGEQLKNELNTVVPVTASLRRALDGLSENEQAGLRRMVSALRSIPAARMEKLLDNAEFFLELDCPVSENERRQLLGNMDWAVFTTIAKSIMEDPQVELNAIVEKLDRLTGFQPLREVLDRHFLRRGQLLRCYRIVSDARRLLDKIKYDDLPTLRKQEKENLLRQELLLNFVSQAHGDPVVAHELTELIQQSFPHSFNTLESTLEEVQRDLDLVFHKLEEDNADFEAWQMLEDHTEEFSAAEQDELRALLGLLGLDTATRLGTAQPHDVIYVEGRQQYWHQLSLRARLPDKRQVAERAVTRYGLILDELSKSERH